MPEYNDWGWWNDPFAGYDQNQGSFGDYDFTWDPFGAWGDLDFEQNDRRSSIEQLINGGLNPEFDVDAFVLTGQIVPQGQGQQTVEAAGFTTPRSYQDVPETPLDAFGGAGPPILDPVNELSPADEESILFDEPTSPLEAFGGPGATIQEGTETPVTTELDPSTLPLEPDDVFDDTTGQVVGGEAVSAAVAADPNRFTGNDYLSDGVAQVLRDRYGWTEAQIATAAAEREAAAQPSAAGAALSPDLVGTEAGPGDLKEADELGASPADLGYSGDDVKELISRYEELGFDPAKFIPAEHLGEGDDLLTRIGNWIKKNGLQAVLGTLASGLASSVLGNLGGSGSSPRPASLPELPALPTPPTIPGSPGTPAAGSNASSGTTSTRPISGAGGGSAGLDPLVPENPPYTVDNSGNVLFTGGNTEQSPLERVSRRVGGRERFGAIRKKRGLSLTGPVIGADSFLR